MMIFFVGGRRVDKERLFQEIFCGFMLKEKTKFEEFEVE
jgi:hypothetical protein